MPRDSRRWALRLGVWVLVQMRRGLTQCGRRLKYVVGQAGQMREMSALRGRVAAVPSLPTCAQRGCRDPRPRATTRAARRSTVQCARVWRRGGGVCRCKNFIFAQ